MKSFRPSFLAYKNKLPIRSFRAMQCQSSIDNTILDLIVVSRNQIKNAREFLYYYSLNTSQYWKSKIRLVWVDNSSSDGTPKFLQHKLSQINGSIMILMSSQIQSLSCRNLGQMIASHQNSIKSKYVMFIDPAQFLQKGWQSQYFQFMQLGNYGMSGIKAFTCDRKYHTISKLQCSATSIGLYYNYVSSSGSVFKVQCFEKIKGFDISLSRTFYQSQDVCLRSSLQGYSIGWNIAARISDTYIEKTSLQEDQTLQKKVANGLNKFQLKWNNRRMPTLIAKDCVSFYKQYS